MPRGFPRPTSALRHSLWADGDAQLPPHDQARLWCAAAVAARMGGTPWPVHTSAGSGNQGLLVSIPVLLAGAEPDELGQALLLAHAVNLYLKAFTGEVSALCGNATGGAGVAAALSWLGGVDLPAVGRSVQLAVGWLYGTTCDGAKASCALRIGFGAASGVLAARMAHSGSGLPGGEGLVGRTVEETARLIGRLTREVLGGTDAVPLAEYGAGVARRGQ